MTVNFYAFLRETEQRKRELGIVDTAENTEAMRNKGGRRTQAKRDLLDRARKRALEAGQEPVRAYW